MITVSSISKSFGSQDVFRDVSFSVTRGARLAIVGPNGIGKTTLLRILCGLDEPSSGTVTRGRSLQVGYLPQEADFQLDGTLWDFCLEPFADLMRRQADLERLEREMADSLSREHALEKYGPLQREFERRGGYLVPRRIHEVLRGLGFAEADFRSSLAVLSGGQRTRAHLARLLLSGPELLLLDEPTNHLDMAAVEWLEGYLALWDGAAVIVSHDRYFLDRACNALLEMASSGTEYYRGSYTTYLRERENRWNHRLEIFERERAKLLKDVGYIKKHIAGQNTLQAKGKLKRLTRTVQAVEQVGIEAAATLNWSQLDVETTTSPFSVEEAERRVRSLRPPLRTAPHLRLQIRPGDRSGDLVLRTSSLEVGFPGKVLFRAPDIELRRGECAALIGPNGGGKSTFLKMILGQLEPLSGEVTLGASLTVGYFAQAHEGLDPDRTVLEEILSVSPHMLPHQGREYLGKYAFSGDDAFKKVSVLSGGERGRLALAKLALNTANLLLLDEPTNHLDIPAQESLQSVLENFEGTVLLVTHDRFLVEALATQIWEIDPDEAHLTVFRGRYSQMKAERERAALRLSEVSREPAPRSTRRMPADSAQKAERRKVARLQELENSISALERELAALSRQLEAPPSDHTEAAKLGLAYKGVQGAMDELLLEWERLQA